MFKRRMHVMATVYHTLNKNMLGGGARVICPHPCLAALVVLIFGTDYSSLYP